MGSENIAIKDTYCGYMLGHSLDVTSIVTTQRSSEAKEGAEDRNIVISASRDKTVIVWKMNDEMEDEHNLQQGEPLTRLRGHNHFVTDLSLTSNSQYLMSSSWDKSLRLWNVNTSKCIQRFSNAQQKEIMSVCFSSDGRQIFSAGCDSKITLWNTKGEQKMVSTQDNHNDWISKIRYSPSAKNKFYASAGWDGKLKTWTEFFKSGDSVVAHDGPINGLAINTNGAYIATGGKDQVLKIWKSNELQAPYKELKCESTINDVAFNPAFQWVAAATDSALKVWNIYGEQTTCVATIYPQAVKSKNMAKPKFVSLAWDKNGKKIYGGCTDGVIRVHKIDINDNQQ